MTRVQDILARVRDTLADLRAERWSDDRLIRLIDEAQLDICMRAKLLRTKASLTVVDGRAEYQLPDDLIQLDRVTLDNKRIELIGFSALDTLKYDWQEDRGQVTHCIFDKQLQGRIRLYPIPHMGSIPKYDFVAGYQQDTSGGIVSNFGEIGRGTILDESSTDFGVINKVTEIIHTSEPDGLPKIETHDYVMFGDFGVTGNLVFDYVNLKSKPSYGIVVGFDNTKFDSDFGVTATVSSDDRFIFNNDFGVIGESLINTGVLSVQYLKKPKKVISSESEIQIDQIFDKAIKYYVVSKCFRDDTDAQNRAVGSEEFQYYLRELEVAKGLDSSDFTVNSTKHWETRYNDGFY